METKKEQYLDIEEVIDLFKNYRINISKKSIYRWSKFNIHDFPKPVTPIKRFYRWNKKEIIDWISNR